MVLEELCEKIELQPEVEETVLKYAKRELSGELRRTIQNVTVQENAKEAYQRLTTWCEKENAGLDMLTYMLLAALSVHERYLEKEIDEKVFAATMKCFTRFVGEHKERYGCYGFDRGWWSYRQLSMVLFRIGELEYEFREDGQSVHLHIPSDADIALSACQESLAGFRIFAKKHFPAYAGAPVTMESWLLSPALYDCLKADSKIIRFKNCFETVSWDKNDTEFLQWVYGGEYAAYEELPEKTSLQRGMKAYLTKGGKIGSAEGILRGF